MLARDIMTENPVALLPSDPASRAARYMRDLDVGAMPVVDEDDMTLIGIVTDRDLAVRCLSYGHGPSCAVSDHMTKHLVTVGPDTDVSEVEEILARARIGRVPVIDDQGKLIGIITQADLAKVATAPVGATAGGFPHGGMR